LPTQAQISPAFGAVAADLFGSGSPALAIAQNLFSREPETGLWRGGLGCILQSSSQEFSALGADRSGFVVAGDGKGLAMTDLDADGFPDLLATQNNDRLLAFRQTAGAATAGSVLIAVHLVGPVGNPLGYGALVTLLADNRTQSSAEIYGGSGYLSQSSATAYFQTPADAKTAEIRVIWPTGEVSRLPVEREARSIFVQFPGPAARL
jgi:hypothetical protein